MPWSPKDLALEQPVDVALQLRCVVRVALGDRCQGEGVAVVHGHAQLVQRAA